MGEILLTFDRLLPAFACAMVADPLPYLYGQGQQRSPSYTAADFQRGTALDGDWLRRTQELAGSGSDN